MIPIRAPEAPDAAALERAVGAASGRGRAVLLAVPSGGEASTLLRRARTRASDTRRCILVAADRFEPGVLASRILADQCNATPPAPRAWLRGWVAHLASEGHELTIALEEPGRLSLDSAGWLGQLVRASRGSVRLLIPWARDARIWRVIEELGLETEVVGVSGAPPGSEDHAPLRTQATRAPTCEPEGPARSPTGGRRARWPVVLAASLAGLGLLAVALRAYLPTRPQLADAGEAIAPLSDRAIAPALAVPPVPAAPEPGAGGYVYDARTGRVSFDVRGEPLTRVLSELSTRLGFELRNLASDPLTQPVSLRVTQVPLEQALRTLLRGYSKSFVYASQTSAAEAPRLRALIILAESPTQPDAEPPEAAAPGDPAGATGVAREVESAIHTLLAGDPGGRHAAAIDRLLALDRAAVAEEVVHQFDALAPVGPLGPTRADEVWEQLRVALCAGRPSADERDELPPELGCRPSSVP